MKNRGPRDRLPTDFKGCPCDECEHEEDCEKECAKFVKWYKTPITKGKRTI